MVIKHNKALKIAAFVVFLAAFAVTEGWLKLGLWPQWFTAGAAVYALSDIV